VALTGVQSGLDQSLSDYVGRVVFVPSKDYSIAVRGRFDEQTFDPHRLEVEAHTRFGALSTSVLFANYDAQPEAGIPYRREGVSLNGSYDINKNWSVNGAALVSLSRYLSDTSVDHFYPAGYSAGIDYKDECTDVSLTYIGKEPLNDGTTNSGQAIWLKVVLRSLGSADIRTRSNDTPN
jgi:LPS-assembly protein